jgi:hypothetical protein
MLNERLVLRRELTDIESPFHRNQDSTTRHLKTKYLASNNP